MASAADVVGKSPGRDSNKSTRIPSGSFRNSLRSLLPFGGSNSNKEPSTPVAPGAAAPPLSPSRLSLSQTPLSSPGFGFGFRRDSSLSKGKGRTGSLQLPSHSSKSSLREDSIRKSSLQLKPPFDASSSSFEPPTLNITSPVRESYSVAALSEKPLPGRPEEFESTPEQETLSATETADFILPPSPGPPFELDNTELSTIVEADTSGLSISKYLPPISASPSTRSKESHGTLLRPQRSLNTDHLSPPYNPNSPSTASSSVADISLSTSGLAAEVRSALNGSASSEWRTEAPIVDADASMGFEADNSGDLDDIDPTLAALLSPHRTIQSSSPDKPNIFHDSRLLMQSSLPRIRPSMDRRASASASPIPTVSSPAISPRAPSSPASSYRRLPDAFRSSSSPTSNSFAEMQANRPSVRRVFTPPSAERPPSSASRRFYGLVSKTGSSTRSSLDIPRGDAPSGLIPSPRIRDVRADDQRFSLDLPPRRQVQDNAQTHAFGDVRSLFDAPQRMRKRSMSVGMEAESSSTAARYTTSRNRYPVGDRPGSSLSIGRSEGYTTNYGSPLASRTDLPSTPGRLDLLGPRTAKAFRAAGLLNNNTTSSHSLADSHTSTINPRYPHRQQMGDANEGLGRSSSVSRAGTSSRIAFSDAGGAPSSSSKHSLPHIIPNWNLQGGESPSPTFSSGRAASTAPTSVSASSRREEYFVNERAREAWEDEKEELKTTHATVVQALADTQRTVRILREENRDLRERLERLERERERERQSEIQRLKDENARFRREMASSSSNSRLHPDMYMNASSSRRGRGNRRPRADSMEAEDEEDEIVIPQASRSRKRSVSGGTSTSSLFVAPPRNMALLMNEDNDDLTGASDFSPYMHQPHVRDRTLMQSSKRAPTGRFTTPRSQAPVPPPPDRLSQANQSYLSSPEVSGVNSSPGSLFLKPEHEVHLGDMEVLDLSSGDF